MYIIHCADAGGGRFKNIYLGTYQNQHVTIEKLKLTKQDLEDKQRLQQIHTIFCKEFQLIWYI
jgi:hypothetical protein